MMRKLAAAVIAASLIAGPALAQNPASVTTSQPAVKADTPMTGVKLIKKHRHHTVKIVKHEKFVTHVKHARHFAHVKHIKHPVTDKTAG